MLPGLPGDKGDFGEKGMGGEDTYGTVPSTSLGPREDEHLCLGPRGSNGIPGRTGCKLFLHFGRAVEWSCCFFARSRLTWYSR